MHAGMSQTHSDSSTVDSLGDHILYRPCAFSRSPEASTVQPEKPKIRTQPTGGPPTAHDPREMHVDQSLKPFL
jgi:hypothetical protein